jgi:hypothetical protein
MLKFFNLKEEEDNNIENFDDVEIDMFNQNEEEDFEMKEEIGSVVMDVVQTKENLMIITPMA